MRDGIWLFRFFCLAVIVVFACGPKPHREIPVFNGESLSKAFNAEYGSLKSLVIKLKVSFGLNVNQEFDLTAVYIFPDSFAFLAEGLLGIDLARGAICGDSGFWELPRKNEIYTISRFDRIWIGDSLSELSVDGLAKMVFFFAEVTLEGDWKVLGKELIFTVVDGVPQRIFCFESQSGRLLYQYLSGADSLIASYRSWRSFAGLRMPRTIRLFDFSGDELAELKIKKISSDRRIPRSMFLPVNQ